MGQIDILKQRIAYNEKIHKSSENYENILQSLLDDSKYIFLSLRYPFDETQTDMPTRYENWQIRCCVELYKLAGTSRVQSYSENGLSWTMFRDGLSEDLRNEIIAKVGVLSTTSSDGKDEEANEIISEEENK